MKLLKRNVAMYFRLMGQQVKVLLEYKIDLLIMSLSSIFTCTLGLIFLGVIFEKIPQINGWSLNQMLLIYGMVTFSEGLASLLFEGVWSLPFSINSGGLDKYLLRPLSITLQVISSKIGVNGLGNIVIGLVIVGYSLNNTGIEWTAGKVIAFLLIFLFVSMISASINLAANSISFWYKNAGISLPVSINGFHEFGKYPINIYNHAIQLILIFILPYAFIGFIPASFLFEKTLWKYLWFICPIASIYCMWGSLFLFKAGLKRYESAGN
ncbi:ABC transporter permease [Paenibacillus sp. 22594]|uniref:ABC transporter permease n=1 Tax=Paenibacillus sp. 22594 TaxID=3453947 RepID=UPI003F86BB26